MVLTPSSWAPPLQYEEITPASPRVLPHWTDVLILDTCQQDCGMAYLTFFKKNTQYLLVGA